MRFKRAEQTPAPAQMEAGTKPPKPRRGHALTIRLKLTLWYGSLFLLAGVLLITVNFLLVRDSLAIAPEKARAVVAETFGIPPERLEPGREPGGPGGPGPGELYIEVENDDSVVMVPVPALIAEAQHELKEEALRQLWMWSLVALAIMTVLTFGLAWLVAGRMLRPLHAITSTARRLSESTLHERIALKGPRDELRELADTFDGMLGRLHASFTAQKEFVANASHELRTPLTIIRTEIDVALDDPKISKKELREMGVAVTEAVDRSESLIDGLLVLAGANRSPNLVALDLADIVHGEVGRVSGEADARGLRLELDLQSAPVRGERSLLERMVGNLLENAIRHNAPDGWFSVKTRQADDWAMLEVANGGQVVPPKEVERLFDRFYRPDRSRSRKTGGFGLGLSIVKSVVTAHEGTVELVAPEEGGLRVTVSLPARPAPASAPASGNEA
jgi:signal transduction histidine kinase